MTKVEFEAMIEKPPEDVCFEHTRIPTLDEYGIALEIVKRRAEQRVFDSLSRQQSDNYLGKGRYRDMQNSLTGYDDVTVGVVNRATLSLWRNG